MKYYAIIEGEQKGPFELSELPEAGVRPSTYVWCKDMADWEKAEDVADICRLFRNRLYDLMHPAPAAVETNQNVSEPSPEQSPYPTRFEILSRGEAKIPTLEEIENMKDFSVQPKVSLPGAFLAILAFPPTGIMAVAYCLKVRKEWKAILSERNVAGNRDSAGEQNNPVLRTREKEAHETARKANMLTLLSFFFGIFLYVTLLSF